VHPTKSYPARFKAAGPDSELEEGQFEALVSVFGNVDAYGDVVMPGAFTDTLAEWEKSGNPIPIFYSHRMDDPDYNIGTVVEAKETDEGLWVRGQLRLNATTSKAPQVYQLLKDRSLAQFSFAYEVIEGGLETREKDNEAGEPEEFYALRKLKLYECGPTPIGANDQTELIGVKRAARHAAAATADLKAGRVLSAKNETTLREALEELESSAAQIKSVLAALDPPAEEDDEKAAPDANAKAEEPTRAKAEELTRTSPAELSALRCIELAAIAEASPA
jgi:uncharacterized protein